VEAAQKKVTNKNLKYEDSLALKQNVLKTLSLSKDTLESVDTLSEVKGMKIRKML
jgi:Leucine-rich repeat (LRR) protein